MILVTGATGTTGRATVNALVAQGAPVRAFVRRPDAALPDGVERAVGSFEEPTALAAALAGVERAYLVTIPAPGMRDQEAAFLKAAADAGVRHVVRLSVLEADAAAPAHLTAREHAAGEQALRDSGIAWTMLRANAFAQNLLMQASAIADHGIYASPLTASAAVSLVDADDIGSVAAATLTQSGHEGRAYSLTGPQALNDDDVVACLSDVLGRPITRVVPSREEAASGLRATGLPEFLVDQIKSLWTYFESGQAAPLHGDILQVTGRPANSLRDVIERHRDVFSG